MLLSVLLGHLLALCAEMLLHGRVNYKLLANRVSGELPDKLVTETLLVVVVACIVDHLVVILL